MDLEIDVDPGARKWVGILSYRSRRWRATGLMHGWPVENIGTWSIELVVQIARRWSVILRRSPEGRASKSLPTGLTRGMYGPRFHGPSPFETRRIAAKRMQAAPAMAPSTSG